MADLEKLEYQGLRVEPDSKSKMELLADQYGLSLGEIGRTLLNAVWGEEEQGFDYVPDPKKTKRNGQKASESVADLLVQLDRMEKMRDGLAREITNAVSVRKMDKAAEERLENLGVQFAAAEKKCAELKSKFLGVPVSPDLPKDFRGDRYKYTVKE